MAGTRTAALYTITRTEHRLKSFIQEVLGEVGLGVIPRANTPATEVPPIHLSNGLPSTRRSCEEHEDADQLLGVGWRRVGEVDNDSLDGAVLCAFVA